MTTYNPNANTNPSQSPRSSNNQKSKAGTPNVTTVSGKGKQGGSDKGGKGGKGGCGTC